MPRYEKCIVAFLDILGFKQIIDHAEFENILGIFQAIITDSEAGKALHHAVDETDEGLDEKTRSYNKALRRYNDSLNVAQIHVMSDSIVVSTPDSHPESLAVVVDICDVIQQKLFNMNTPILLRGAVAIGDFFSNGNILFGKGLVDAYLAQERYAVYPRVILPNELTIGRRVSIGRHRDLPKDDDGYYRIDSIERYLNVDDAQSWEEIERSEKYDKLVNLIDVNLNGYSADGIRQKYLWLRNLFHAIQAQFIHEEIEGVIAQMGHSSYESRSDVI